MPITTKALKDFRTHWQKIRDYVWWLTVPPLTWKTAIDPDAPGEPAGKVISCKSCYQAAFQTPGYFAPKSGGGQINGDDFTNASQDTAKPNATYKRLVAEIGQLNEDTTDYCAGLPGGYFSKPFRGPMLYANRPAVTPFKTVCPYVTW
jgi:hypothetical protein